MRDRKDNFIANRIKWRASGFATINSFMFSALENGELKEEVSKEFEAHNGGEPVLVNIPSGSEWISIGTHKVLWKSRSGGIEQAIIDNIERTTPQNLKVKKLPGSEITTLEIHMKDGSLKLMRCCAKDLFQFTSIFLMLTRLQK